MIQQQGGPFGRDSNLESGDSGLRQHAQAAVNDVADEAREAGRTLRDEAVGLAEHAKEQLGRHAAAGKDQVADRVASLADHVHASAQGLRGGESWLADLVDQGARQLGGLAESIKDRDLRGLLATVEGFARDQPALFAGASVALGFATARLAKASSGRGGRPDAPAGDLGGDGAEHGWAAPGRQGAGYATPAAPVGGSARAEQTLAATGRDSGAQRPYAPHDEQPGAGGHDRAVVNERWRSPDLPIGDPSASPIGGAGAAP